MIMHFPDMNFVVFLGGKIDQLLETAVKQKVYEDVKCESLLFGCKDRAEEPDAQETVRSSLEEPWVG